MIKKYAKLDAQNVILGEEFLDSENLPAHKLGRLKEIIEIIPTLESNQALGGFTYEVDGDTIVKTYSVRTMSEREYFLKRVPKGEVALWAFKAVAKIHGYMNEINILLAQLPEPHKTIAEAQWEYATVIERDHPTTNAIAATLGLSQTELNNMFLEAKQIQGY